MLRPTAWRDKRKVQSALKGYPAYSPPHLRSEIELPLSNAKENFDYFLQQRPLRLRSFHEVMKTFNVNATTDDGGLAAVSKWFLRYGGLLLYFRRHSTITGRAFVEYDPPWIGEHIGINFVWDLATYVGECVIQRRPSAHWALNTGDADPISREAVGFQRPCVAGLYWPTECDPMTYVFTDSKYMSHYMQVGGPSQKMMIVGSLVEHVAVWSKANPPNPTLKQSEY